MPGEATAQTETDLLRQFLHGRDVPCPSCEYNLRDLPADRCPECGQELALRLQLAEPKQAALLTGLIALSAGAGLNGLLIIYFVLMQLRYPTNGTLSFLVTILIGFTIFGAATALWLTFWRRIRRSTATTRWLLASACCALALIDIVVFSFTIRDAMQNLRRCVALVVAISLVLSCGCAGRRLNTIAWFPILGGAGKKEVKQVAPATAVYKVKFSTRPDADRDDLRTLGSARRYLRQGDFLGFTTGDDGRVYAIAGNEVFPLRERPNARRQAACFVWSYKTVDRGSNEIARFFQDAGNILLAAGAVTGLVALWVLSWWADTRCQHQDDCR